MAGTVRAGLRAYNQRQTIAKLARSFGEHAVTAGVGTAIGTTISQLVGWDDNQETPQQAYMRHNGLTLPTNPPPAQSHPQSAFSRGKKRSHDQAFSRTIFDSSPSTASTQPVLTGSGTLSKPTQPWYRIQNSLRVNPNSSPNWLRISNSPRRNFGLPTPSDRSTAPSQRWTGNSQVFRKNLKNLTWFRTRLLLKARAYKRRLAKAKGRINLAWAKHLFARQAIPRVRYRHPIRPGVLRHLARLKQRNFRRHLATRKSAQFASRYYRRLVRHRQRKNRRRR